MKWWYSFREWVLLMWYGKRPYSGYDFESGPLPLLLVGQINRVKKIDVEYAVQLNVPALVRAVQQMGVSFSEAAKAFGGMGEVLREAKQEMDEEREQSRPTMDNINRKMQSMKAKAR